MSKPPKENMMLEITQYFCPGCGNGGILDESNTVVDDIGDRYCDACGEQVKFHGTRPAEWASLAVYAVDRIYGGPEEGGWYYDAGVRVDESLRCFGAEDFHQIGVYKDLWTKRIVDEQHPIQYRRVRMVIKTYAEKVAPASFPERTPRYC